MNTLRVAEAMAEVLNAKLVKSNEITVDELVDYDLKSYGSGVYAFDKNKDLIGFIEVNNPMEEELIHIFHITPQKVKKREDIELK